MSQRKATPRIVPAASGTAHERNDKPLLMTRTTAARRLGCCRITLWRLEKEGVLTPIKLSRSPVGRVFYRVAQIEALVLNGVA